MDGLKALCHCEAELKPRVCPINTDPKTEWEVQVHTPFKKADRLTVELQKLRVLPAKLREHAGAVSPKLQAAPLACRNDLMAERGR